MMATHSPDLYSLVLILIPTQVATVGATVGHQAHAAFLKVIREVDPALAEMLHQPNAPVRPFTVSPLLGVGPARQGRVYLSPEETYGLRFTILQPAIFERFMARFLESEDRPLLCLDRASLVLREILVTPGSHPWAGYTSWAQLAAEARPEKEITLEFTSPTAFGFGQKAWGKKVVVLPDPVLVFESLLRSWNLLAPPPLRVDKESLMAYLQEDVVIKRIERLETRIQEFKHAPQVGFVGQVTYGLMAENDYAQRVLNALARLAFYCGVGMKTAMGMGQCRMVRS
ncbi:MAG: CRISPR-associated endoribonuclease Cas6 [Anaerolineae bacterium]|jgi:CRISPR-associated endoribonuclease Cas6